MEKIEEKIREKLAQNLDIFNADLKLIDQEEFLPNKKGTRGFVDLLASDSNLRYVLIELKRSKSASREAIHEVFKYIEGIKENKSLKNDEVVAYIVSTEWDELLVPFSSFVSQVSYEVKGFNLIVDDQFDPIEVSIIEPIKLENERFISDQHAVCLYTNKETLRKGIESHVTCFKEKGIQDYALLVLKAHPDLYEFSLKSTAKQLEDIATKFGGKPSKTYEDLKEIMPEYMYMIYSAVQVMGADQYWAIIKRDPEQYDEMLEISEEMEEKELLNTLHEYAVENTVPRPFQEHYEIGYPAKLKNKFIEDEGWEIIDIIRNGKLKENELLTDEALVKELSGNSGTNKQVYSKNFHSGNAASLEQIKKDVNICLIDNKIWLSGIDKALTEIAGSTENGSYQGRIHIFNPSNTLLSLYRSAVSSSQVEAMQAVPSYYINIEYEEFAISYFGCLVRNGNKINLQEVLSRTNDGDAFSLLFSLTWGGYQANDIDICPLYGLEYANFKCEVEGEDRVFYNFDGYRYKNCNDTDPFYEYFQFMRDSPDFIQEVVKLFNEATLTQGIIEF